MELDKTMFGETSDDGRGNVAIFINSELVLTAAKLPQDHSSAPILGCLLATVLHEYSHYLCMKRGLKLTPVIRAFSRFYSIVDEKVAGESGFCAESAIFGGVMTLLIRCVSSSWVPHSLIIMVTVKTGCPTSF
jgi:hypothetical protein